MLPIAENLHIWRAPSPQKGPIPQSYFLFPDHMSFWKCHCIFRGVKTVTIFKLKKSSTVLMRYDKIIYSLIFSFLSTSLFLLFMCLKASQFVIFIRNIMKSKHCTELVHKDPIFWRTSLFKRVFKETMHSPGTAEFTM